MYLPTLSQTPAAPALALSRFAARTTLSGLSAGPLLSVGGGAGSSRAFQVPSVPIEVVPDEEETFVDIFEDVFLDLFLGENDLLVSLLYDRAPVAGEDEDSDLLSAPFVFASA